MLKNGWLKEQKYITSKYWRPEVWHQGGCRAALSLTTLGENPPGCFWCLLTILGLWVWHSGHMNISSLVLFHSVHICFCVQISPFGGWEAGSIFQLVIGLSHLQIEKVAQAFICWHCMPWTLNSWVRPSICLRFSVAPWLLLSHYVF